MPPPSKIDQLPPQVRHELDQRLIAAAFGGSVALSEWLAEQGYEISKTTVNERAKKLKRRLAAISASTEAMKLVAEAAPDETADRSNAIISLVQTDMFEALVEFQEAAAEDTEEITPAQRIALYGKTAKSIAELTRAAISREKFAADIRDQARADLLKEQEARLDDAVRAQGLDENAARFWRDRVLMGKR